MRTERAFRSDLHPTIQHRADTFRGIDRHGCRFRLDKKSPPTLCDGGGLCVHTSRFRPSSLFLTGNSTTGSALPTVHGFFQFSPKASSVLHSSLSGTAIGEILGHGVLPSAEHILIQAIFITGQCRFPLFRSQRHGPAPRPAERADPAHSPSAAVHGNVPAGSSTKTHYQTTIKIKDTTAHHQSRSAMARSSGWLF